MRMDKGICQVLATLKRRCQSELSIGARNSGNERLADEIGEGYLDGTSDGDDVERLVVSFRVAFHGRGPDL